MNRYLTFAAILLVCSSCSVYQYNVLKSDSEGTPDEPFTFENDSLKLQYSFSNGDLQIDIFNKGTKPLYVDWSRSAFIVNGETLPYFNGRSNIELTTTEYRNYFNPRVATAYTSGTIDNGSPVSFIPPDSRLRNIPFNITQRVPVIKTQNSSEKHKSYTEDSSPFKFRSYLMMSFNQDFSETIQLDHHFWLAETHQYNAEPIVSPKQNAYMTTKLTEGGTVVLGVVGISAMVGAVIIGASAAPAPAGQ